MSIPSKIINAYVLERAKASKERREQQKQHLVRISSELKRELNNVRVLEEERSQLQAEKNYLENLQGQR